MMQTKFIHLLFLTLCSHALIKLASISCLPNIRIQVNNENLQSPPYLLEAIKQVEASESATLAEAARFGQPIAQLSPNITAVPESRTGSETIRPKPAINNKTYEEEVASEESEPHSFSVVKEETIEEILDIDPESVLKLSPESVISGISPSDYSRITDNVASETSNNNQEYVSLEDNKQANDFVVKKHETNQNRKAQLPVSNAHLKKPAILLDNEGSDESGSQINGTIVPKSGGAQSIISPSVVVDEAQPQVNLAKKNGVNSPDTWEPNQVMNGVTNASLVPATLNKEYGSTTRTRITLGGGYVRDRLPPLVNPASSGYSDDRPEKPVVPLERPHLAQSSSNQKEISRVIEVPEKIVLPASVSKLSEQSNLKASNFTQTAAVGKPDLRCPKKGVMTFEHPTACDKYFYCEDGLIFENTCPNGLMYGTRDMVNDYCVHRWKVNCEEKTVPNPISSPGCRWQYGIFNVQGSPKCSPDFYECTAGRFEVKRCSIDGQIYDDRTKSCQFAETVGCVNEALADFHCPADDQGNTYWPFPRYFLNERALIHCVNDKPEIVRCTDDERVDPEHLHCVPLAKLKETSVVSTSNERKARERKKNTE